MKDTNIEIWIMVQADMVIQHNILLDTQYG